MAAKGSDDRAGRAPRPAPPKVKRWFQERPSPYAHEQEALDHVERLMPKAEPFRAWATFSFTAASGRVNECDLLVLVPRGLFLVELKGHPGRLVNNGDTWNFHGGRVRTIRNPYHLTDLKSKELRNRLRWAANKRQLGVAVPRVEPAVFLSAPDLVSELDEQQRIRVYGRNDRETGLPKVWDDFLGLPPSGESEAQRREYFRFATLLPDLMRTIGVRASTAHLHFDNGWELSGRPIDGGPAWEDRLAVRRQPFHEEGRVRIYLVGDQPDEQARRDVERAARREYQVLQGINHRGIAQALDFRDHAGGPAILFRHDAADLRLDDYLATHGDALTRETRLDLVRQLADALRHAHGRSLYHRALAARSVYVSCRSDGSSPVLRVIDWQVAARDFGAASPKSIGDSSIHSEHVSDSAQVYLPPEFGQSYADPVDLDLFGLGAVAYLVLTGQPPAVSRPELLQRLRVEGGLHPRAASDVSDALDALVYSVTRTDVADRPESVRDFVAGLDAAEQARAADEAVERVGADPLTALPGQRVDGGWLVERVLGTGATSRVLLVSAETVDAEGAPRAEERVVKVALDEERAARLHDEAEALGRVGGGHVVRLIDGPRQIHERTVLVLECAGERSLGAKLRSEGRLTYHELSRFGEDLFVALDHLAAHGVRHRDVKPDNLGVFRRADGSWQLKLFDFSLAGVPDRELKAGTPGYLDPFLGVDRRRGEYDDHAELYAAAVTLHEMASGERPRWGEGMTDPAVLDDELPALATELLEPALRAGLTAFFERALHRAADRRFDNLRQMRDAWRAVFTAAEATAPVSTPATVDAAAAGGVPVEEARDRAAEAAELDTPLGAAGLSPAAESAADQLGAATVGELLEVQPHLISKARGTGAMVRKELNRRRRQWRTRLRGQAGVTLAARPGGAGERGDGEPGRGPGRMGVEELARLVAPEPSGRSRRVKAVRLLLGLPEEDGAPSPLPSWCTQSEVAARLGVRQSTVSDYHRGAMRAWAGLDGLSEPREELVGHVRAAGGVMTAEELAAELRARRGAREDGDHPDRTAALALAVVRAAVEAETWQEGKSEEDQPRLAVLRRGARVLVVAESLPGTDDPAPADLADYARALGEAADRLVAVEPLPGRSAVLRDLRGVAVPEGMAPLADTRLVALAAEASGTALYSPRLELYPRGLGLARALRISQAAAGVHRERGATGRELLERVRSRFPGLELGDPTRVQVEEALAEAGFRLEYDPETHRFVPPAPPMSSGWLPSTTGLYGTGAAGAAVAAAAAGRDPRALLSERLDEAVRRGGFLALTLSGRRLPGAADALAAAYRLVQVDLGALFVAELRALAEEQGRWDAVLRSDEGFTASGEMSRGLHSYAKAAWRRAGERLRGRVAEAGPRAVVLLHGAGVASRYHDAGGHELLAGLQNAARRAGEDPHGLWLLCPTDVPQAAPRLDGRVVEVLGDHERAVLTGDFLRGGLEVGVS